MSRKGLSVNRHERRAAKSPKVAKVNEMILDAVAEFVVEFNQMTRRPSMRSKRKKNPPRLSPCKGNGAAVYKSG